MISTRAIHWSESQQYGFVTGRVRALETLLLDRVIYERLIRAEGVEEFVALLTTTRYGDFLRLVAEGDVRKALSLAAEENFNFILQYAAERWLRDLLWLNREVFNLKVVLKSRWQEEQPTAESRQPTARWKKVPDEARRLAEVGNEVFLKAKERNDPAVIDLELDRFNQQMALSLTQGQDYAQGYYRLLADVTNIKTLFRLKVLGEEEIFPDAFLPGGELALRLLLQVLKTNNFALLKKSRFGDLVQAGVRALSKLGILESKEPAQLPEEESSFLPLERQVRAILIDYINTARFVALGYEPLFRFYLLREEELRNLRLLYAAKVAGLAPKECQELVVYG